MLVQCGQYGWRMHVRSITCGDCFVLVDCSWWMLIGCVVRVLVVLWLARSSSLLVSPSLSFMSTPGSAQHLTNCLDETARDVFTAVFDRLSLSAPVAARMGLLVNSHCES